MWLTQERPWGWERRKITVREHHKVIDTQASVTPFGAGHTVAVSPGAGKELQSYNLSYLCYPSWQVELFSEGYSDVSQTFRGIL
jgi:hypothetical protein